MTDILGEVMHSIFVLVALAISFSASAETKWGWDYGTDSQGNYKYCYGYTVNNYHYCTDSVFQPQRTNSIECYNSSDCSGGYSCVNGSCERPGSGWGCHSNMDCQVGERCVGGSCG